MFFKNIQESLQTGHGLKIVICLTVNVRIKSLFSLYCMINYYEYMQMYAFDISVLVLHWTERERERETKSFQFGPNKKKKGTNMKLCTLLWMA